MANPEAAIQACIDRLDIGYVDMMLLHHPDHIQENTELYHFELTEEEMAQINALDRNEKHDWY